MLFDLSDFGVGLRGLDEGCDGYEWLVVVNWRYVSCGVDVVCAEWRMPQILGLQT